jgi:outer membrane protein, multidrug efflux system
MRQFAALLAAMALGSCTVGPDYHRPIIATPASFQDLPDMSAAPISTPVMGKANLAQWWTQFHNGELQRLIGVALKQNLDLMAAASRIREAREQETVAGAAALPTLNATGAAVKLHSNSNPLAAFAGTANGGMMGGSYATNVNFFSTGFDATWEVDAFGGVRRSVEAAKANTEAAVWALRDGEVSLTAEVARDYLILRAAQDERAIVESQVARENTTLGIVEARAQTGFVSAFDVDQQKQRIAATKAQIPTLDTTIRVSAHALGDLLGKEPEALSNELNVMGALPTVPKKLPVGLPSDLLRRRPDIRQAERQLAASSARVGVAVAQLYPRFNLLGLASLGSNTLGNLLSTSNFTGAVAGLFTWPIFAADKARADVRIDQEKEDQAYLTYRKSVLGALKDVEDALTRYDAEQRRLQSLNRSLDAANGATTIAEQQYQSGTTNYLSVLTADNAVLSLQDQIAQSNVALAEDLVSLYKALGGGWSEN